MTVKTRCRFARIIHDSSAMNDFFRSGQQFFISHGKMMSMEDKIELLGQFVQLCKSDPSILHDRKFAFFKEYLESLGATIPQPSQRTGSKLESEETGTAGKDMKDDEAEVEDLELDMSGVIEAEKSEPLPMGLDSKEVSEDDIQKANEERDQAMSAVNEGDFEKAVKHYTNAIELNPGSAVLFAKRAGVLLKLNKPKGAIRDCDKALSLNADSAQAYKFRGRAHRLLGNFLEAHRDLALACQLDYDEVANEWLKEVEENAKKIANHKRNEERRRDEKEEMARRERVKEAQEARQRAAEQEKNAAGNKNFGGFPGMEGFEDKFSKLVSDPEVLALLQDEAVLTAYMDIAKNPANICKHISNPKVMKLIGKLGSGAGGPFGNFGKMSEESGGAQKEESSKMPPQPKKVPEPDLD